MNGPRYRKLSSRALKEGGSLASIVFERHFLEDIKAIISPVSERSVYEGLAS